MTERIYFQPDWVSSPGETIVDILQERNLKPSEFARRLGCTTEFADSLLEGRAEITIQIARQLTEVLGASTAFWMTREAQYRQDLVRLRPSDDRREATAWLAELPVQEMHNFGWLNPYGGYADEVDACLRFFGVHNVRAWREAYENVIGAAAFRTSSSFNSEFGAVAAWLRQGELEAASISSKVWHAGRFENTLQKIRPLTRRKDPVFFIPELMKMCAESGVAVVVLRVPSGCRASGATRFISPTKALMLLSFRYLSDDHFWFTFFHEAGHLLLHRKEALFLEGGGVSSPREEMEANDFAGRILIPPEYQAALLKLRCNSHEVIRFSREIGVSPGIVVGQMQHLGLLPRSHLNGLKRRFVWVNN